MQFDEEFFSRAEGLAATVAGPADFRGRGRDPHDIRARAILWRMLMTRCGLTLKDLAKAYGYHHTAILRAIDRLDPPSALEQEACRHLPYVSRPRHRFHTQIVDAEPGVAPRLVDFINPFRRPSDICAGCGETRENHQ
jgi:hypothetical protein